MGGKRAIEKKLLDPPPSWFARYKDYKANMSSLSNWFKLSVKDQEKMIQEYDETTKDLDKILEFQENIDLMLNKQSEIFCLTKLGTWAEERKNSRKGKKKRTKSVATRVSVTGCIAQNNNTIADKFGQQSTETTPYKPVRSCQRIYSPPIDVCLQYNNQTDDTLNREIISVVNTHENDNSGRSGNEQQINSIADQRNAETNSNAEQQVNDEDVANNVNEDTFSYKGIFECAPSDNESGFEVTTTITKRTKKKTAKHFSSNDTPKSNEIMHECNDIFLVQVRNVFVSQMNTQGGAKEIKRLKDNKHIITVTCRS